MHSRSLKAIDPRILQCRDGACRFFTDLTGVVEVGREGWRLGWRVECRGFLCHGVRQGTEDRES